VKRKPAEVTDEMVAEVVRHVAATYEGTEPEHVDWLVRLTKTLRDNGRKAAFPGFTPLDFARAALDGGIVASQVRFVEEQLGEKVGCRAGCSACCHYTVSVIGEEADRIAARVMLMPEERRAEVLARVREGVRLGLDQLDPNERLRRRFPCPLLDGGLCSVYDDRPIACRSWHGISEERCASVDEQSPFGLLALIGDCASFAVDLATDSATHEAGDLLTLLAERLGIGKEE
jgi:Fe-S-cluster containining protein